MHYPFNILLISPHGQSISCLQSSIDPNFGVGHAYSFSDASLLLSEKPGHISVVLVMFSPDTSSELTSFLRSLQGIDDPEVIICVDDTLKNKAFSSMTHFLKQGAFDLLILPSFPEEINWVIQKALAYFRTKHSIIKQSGTPFNAKLSTAFFDLLLKRKEKGIPVTLHEIKQFFSPNHPEHEPFETFLEQFNHPPIEAYEHITILIVEDEIDWRNMYSKALRKLCFKVIEATSGEDAIDIVKSTDSIDIIILDIALNDGKPGNILIPVFKKYHPTCEIIMMTAFGHFDLLTTCIRAGAYDYLLKNNTSMDILTQKVSGALNKKHLQHLLEQPISNE